MTKKKVKLSLPDKMIKFCESLLIPAGDNVGGTFKLLDFQKNMIQEVYGSVNQDGYRIVNEAILTIGRKNGKTGLCASLALAHLWLPDLAIQNQEILVVAWTIQQATNLFSAVAEMIKMDSELIHDFEISNSRKHIKHRETGGVLRVEAAEASGLHGSNPSVVFVDECGAFSAEKGRATYSVLTTGFGARKESLVWLLSTQAPSDNHFFSEKIDYGKMVNSGEIVDPKFKAFIYEVPAEDDIYNEDNWIKANPGIDIIRSRDELRKKSEEAKRLPPQEAFFRQLFMNQRVDSYSPFITKSLWDANGGLVDLEKLEGKECWVGIDLSAKTDISAVVMIFPDENDPPKFDIVSFFWKPENLLREQSLTDRVPYQSWAERGFILTCPGNTISFDWIAQKLFDLSQKYKIKMAGFDRWHIVDLKNALDRVGCPIVLQEIGQGFKDQSPCCDIMLEMVLNKRLRHGNNPAATWQVSNAVTETDPAGNLKLTKKKSYGRIDFVIALGMALRIWDLNKGQQKSIYESEEFFKYMMET